LTGSEISQFLEEQVAIRSLAEKFVQDLNRSEQDGGEWFTEEELDGIPSTALESWGPTKHGKYFVPCERDRPVIAREKREETRLRMYVANERRFTECTKLLKDIAVRRDAQARKLGYAGHAAVRMEKLASPSVEWVTDRIDKFEQELSIRGNKLHENIRRERVREKKERRDFKKGDDCLPPWDFVYYMRQLRGIFEIILLSRRLWKERSASSPPISD
jgi:metallopeptidase MepB